MGSSPPSAPPSPEFLAAFRAEAGAAGRLRFEQFMALALYHPQLGYYRRDRPRVGYGSGTDFFTASTSGPVFGELVAAAAAELIRREGADPNGYTFVEVGAETRGGVLEGATHPFAAARCVPLGEPSALTGRCVVFSNELFDAQPCARYVRTESGWAEVFVRLEGEQLVEEAVPLAVVPEFLPADAGPGYRFDAPRAAAELAASLAREPWHGLFLAFDYGKTEAELQTETPAGTVRAYRRHRQSNDLLAHPGEQDLTCHVCWDWLAERLRGERFSVSPVVAQEAFFLRHAAAVLAPAVEADAARLTARKLSLMQLLHPAHLGRKFQVLGAWRTAEDCPCTG